MTNKRINVGTGSEAISDGLRDGGVEVVTNFPGYYSHKLFSSLGGSVTSINEKAAYDIAWGASYAGKRAAVMFKNVGLSHAADPFLNSYLVGTRAGMVVIVFDDVEVEGSQSRQDSRHYFDFFGGLWLEPDTVERAYELAYESFDWSEKFHLPIVIRITNQLVYLKGSYTRISTKKRLVRAGMDKKQYVMHPVNSVYQRKILASKNIKIKKFVNSLYNIVPLGRAKSKVIVFGCCDKELRKLASKNLRPMVYPVFTYPIPIVRLRKIIKNDSKTTVIEHGDCFGLEKIRAILGQSITLVPGKEKHVDHSKGYIVSGNYEKLFMAINNFPGRTLIGDLGEYTMDTFKSVDACLCFGASLGVGVGVGLAKATSKPIFVVTGDAAYLHSGKNVIPEALVRKIDINIIVVCNGGSKGTGGQLIPGDLYYQPDKVAVYKVDYEKTTRGELEVLLTQMVDDKQLSIMYLSMPN